MLTPKPPHLVERLLSSGALGGSATQLLEPVQHPPAAQPAAKGDGAQVHGSPAPLLEAAPPRGPALDEAVPDASAPTGASVAPPVPAQSQRVAADDARPCEGEGPGTTDRGDAGREGVAPRAGPGDDTSGGPGDRKRGGPGDRKWGGTGSGASEVAQSFAPVAPAAPAPPASGAARPGMSRRPEAEAPPGERPVARAVDAAALQRAGMVDWSRARSRISEEFRLVQRQILRAAFGPGAQPGFSNLLMVTSARPGEGKSFMSLNMAGSIGRQGDNHVLLVDADSKRDSICYSLGLSQARGLTDLAADPLMDPLVDPGPLIVHSPIERLSILPVGRERGADLFSTKEMARLIQSLGRRYADRLLILDAPPCLSTSDPAVLAQVVGQILFVVEAERTQRGEVEASLDLVQACPTITLVLNKQKVSSRFTFGAYSSYYGS